MSSGRTHLISNIITGAGMIVASNIYHPDIVAPVIIGSIAGTMITPDMDLEGTTITEKMVRRVPIIGLIWQVSWYPYALMASHRGLSHNVILGTLGRIAWLFVIVVLYVALTIGILYILGRNIPEMPSIYIEYKATLVILATWYIQDINHYILDYLSSEGKRRGKRNSFR